MRWRSCKCVAPLGLVVAWAYPGLPAWANSFRASGAEAVLTHALRLDHLLFGHDRASLFPSYAVDARVYSKKPKKRLDRVPELLSLDTRQRSDRDWSVSTQPRGGCVP